LRQSGYGSLIAGILLRLEADGVCFDYSEYALVVVATLVQRKADIARRVLDTSPEAFSACAPPLAAISSGANQPMSLRSIGSCLAGRATRRKSLITEEVMRRVLIHIRIHC
jgi:hypothetical protein